MEKQTITIERMKEILPAILIMFLIIAAGLFIVNQYVSFRYKIALMKEPCALCIETNPLVTCYVDENLNNNKNINYSSINLSVSLAQH